MLCFMANTKTVSVLVSEGLLADAAALALAEKRSRNYILARWMAMGKWAETGMVGSNPEVRVGVESRFAKILRGGDEAQDKKLRGVGGVVEGQDVGMVAGSPGPVFGGETNFGPTTEHPDDEKFDLMERYPQVKEFFEMPIDALKERAAMVRKDIGLEVPDEAVGFIEAMRKKVEAFTGADPETIKAAQPTVQKKKAQPKKIASGPGPATGAGFQHDTENCRIYGCLMCKSAKGE